MLPYVLALVIGLGSFAYYMAAFFFPEVHRKSDFIWSGVGFFYALVLWVCAGRITGAVLLSQIASVSLLGWLGWETLTLRRQLALPEAQTEISPQVQQKIVGSGIFQLAKSLVVQPVARVFRKTPVKPTPIATAPEPVTEPPPPKTELATAKTELGEPVPETVTEIIEEVQPPSPASDIPVASPTEVTEETPEEPVIADITESADVTETLETTPTEPVEEFAVETTPPEPIGEFAPDEFPAETPTAAQPLTETPVAEIPAEEQTLTQTPLTPTQNQPKQRQGISGFFNNLLGKGKGKPDTTKEPQTISEDIPPAPAPDIPASSQPDTFFDTSPTPNPGIEETAAVENLLTDETSTVDSPPEPERPQNKDTQPPVTVEESTAQDTQPADSEPLMRPYPPASESSTSPDTPVAASTPETPLSPPAEPMGEGNPQTRQSQDEENPSP